MQSEVMSILRDAKRLAQQYRRATGKPLGITGEVAEYEAARLLGLRLTEARQAGFDAIEEYDGNVRCLQIKGRCLLSGCKPGQRMGSIDVEKQFDSVLLVLLGENFDVTEIYPTAVPCWRPSPRQARKPEMSAARCRLRNSRQSAAYDGAPYPRSRLENKPPRIHRLRHRLNQRCSKRDC